MSLFPRPELGVEIARARPFGDVGEKGRVGGEKNQPFPIGAQLMAFKPAEGMLLALAHQLVDPSA